MEAVRLIRSGWSTRKVARHFGFTQSAIVKWVKRAPADLRARGPPERHRLAPNIIRENCANRGGDHRVSQEIQPWGRSIARASLQDGISVSLSSVKRTLKRNHLTYPSKWKKWHQYPPRPYPHRPASSWKSIRSTLAPQKTVCISTPCSTFARAAHAIPSLRISTHHSLRFVDGTKIVSPFAFRTIQSDHGRFSKWFTNGSWSAAWHIGTAGYEPRTTTPTSSGSTGPSRTSV